MSGAGVAGAAASEKAAETQSVIIIMIITTIIMINSRSVVSAPECLDTLISSHTHTHSHVADTVPVLPPTGESRVVSNSMKMGLFYVLHFFGCAYNDE